MFKKSIKVMSLGILSLSLMGCSPMWSKKNVGYTTPSSSEAMKTADTAATSAKAATPAEKA